MAILCEGGEEIDYASGECVPRKLDGERDAQLVVFCRTIPRDFIHEYHFFSLCLC